MKTKTQQTPNKTTVTCNELGMYIERFKNSNTFNVYTTDGYNCECFTIYKDNIPTNHWTPEQAAEIMIKHFEEMER